MTEKIFNIRVPPTGKVGADILIVGEAPGERESEEKVPFVGPSGDLLNSILMRHGVDREDVYVMNLSEFQPAGNKFENLLGSWQLKEGLEKVYDYIAANKPKVIIALGNYPMEALTGFSGITAYRGSILPNSIFPNIKVIPTFHPAYVIRDQSNYPVLDLDIKRAIEEVGISGFAYPEYSFVIAPKGIQLEEAVEEILNSEQVAVDIESVKGSTYILCVGFAISSTKAFCLVNDNSSEYRHAISRLLSSAIRKIFHNGSFDVEMLYLNGFDVQGYDWDTQIAQHNLNPELPKSLAFLTSVYTRQPYYKNDGKEAIPEGKDWNKKKVREELWTYNCKDCCVTFDIAQQQRVEMKVNDLEYQMEFSMQLREVAQEISRNGILINEETRGKFRKALNDELTSCQNDLNQIAGGELNVNSPKQVQNILYEQWKLPVRKKRGGGVTSDEDAIVASIAWLKDKIDGLKSQDASNLWKFRAIGLKLLLKIRGIRKLLSSYIDMDISNDGRVRSSYKVDATETNRWAAQLYVDGTGVNAQTFPREAVEI